ncbi:unnamed protein product [Paramecium pentaurelia]|uniref:Uncharacterized protein n=1 Tax=Paramecium pentaurelia TaxID=43138 RepID=A0A8S1Y8C0_9CILI|nr:unnamed protein product [Paramecium pentaurelia]
MLYQNAKIRVLKGVQKYRSQTGPFKQLYFKIKIQIFFIGQSSFSFYFINAYTNNFKQVDFIIKYNSEGKAALINP